MPGVDCRLALDSPFEQFPPARTKIPLELRNEGERLGRKDLGVLRAHRRADCQSLGFDA